MLKTVMLIILICAVVIALLYIFPDILSPYNPNTKAKWITLDDDWEKICKLERNKGDLSLEKGGPEEPKLTTEEVVYLRNLISTEKAKKERRDAKKKKAAETAAEIQDTEAKED